MSYSWFHICKWSSVQKEKYWKVVRIVEKKHPQNAVTVK